MGPNQLGEEVILKYQDPRPDSVPVVPGLLPLNSGIKH
jgi:hypothetical protein